MSATISTDLDRVADWQERTKRRPYRIGATGRGGIYVWFLDPKPGSDIECLGLVFSLAAALQLVDDHVAAHAVVAS